MFVLASGLYLVAVGCACALPVSLALVFVLQGKLWGSLLSRMREWICVTGSSKQIQSGMKALTTHRNHESAPLRHRCSSTVSVVAGVCKSQHVQCSLIVYPFAVQFIL
jgi:hypothetical protein